MQRDVLKGISYSLTKTLAPHELIQVAGQLGSTTAFNILQFPFCFPPIRTNVLSVSAAYWIHKYYRMANCGMSGTLGKLATCLSRDPGGGGSGNTGKYSVLDLGIIPPFGRADTVDLKWNISPYCPPSPAKIYIYSVPNTRY